MANNGSIDEVIGSEAGKQVDVLTEKMNALYVAFKQNITAINLVNDALSKSVSIKDVSENVDKATKSTKKLKDVQTEFVETVVKLDKAVSDTGHALSEQEVAMAKLTATMANGNKAAKLVSESTKVVNKDATDLKNAYARLNDEYKASLIHSKNLAVQYGVTSKEFKAAATQTNLMGAELKNIDAQLGIHSKNVGNYAAGVEKGMEKTNFSIGKIWGGLRQLAYLIPGIGLAGMFNLAFEAIGKVYDKIMQVNEATQKMKDIQSAFDKGVESGYKEVAMLQSLYEEATNVLEPMDKRLKAVDSLQKQYPEYFKNLKDEAILAGSARDVYIELSDAIEQSVINRAFLAETDEMAKDLPKQIMMLDELTAKRAEMYQGGSSGWVFGAKESAKQTDAFKKLVEEIKVIPGIGEEMAKKILATGDGSVSGAMNTVITELSTNIDAVKGKIQGLLKYANDNYGKTVLPVDKDLRNPKKPKEVNRISELKNQFEAEKLVIDTENEKGYTSELEYRNKLLTLINEYVNARETALGTLSQHEKESQTSFNISLLGETKSNTKAIEKYYADQLKMMEVYDAQVKKNDEIKVKDKQTVNEKYEALDDKLWEAQFAGSKAQFDDVKAKLAAEIKLKQDKAVLEEAIIKASFSIANSITDAIHAKELQQIEDKATALEEAHNREIKQIEQSGLTSIQQTKAKAKADAQYEAEKKKIDKDRKKALREEARLNRDIALLEVAIRTAANIVKEFHNPYLMAAAAALGISQAAAIALKPLPQYAKGRGKGKAEHAIVGEAGQEAIIRENGKVELTPNKATITYLNPNDQVISHHDLIKNASYVHLMKQGNVSTSTNDKFQSAEIVEEIKDLKKVLINKNLSVNTTNYSGFDSYLKANIR